MNVVTNKKIQTILHKVRLTTPACGFAILSGTSNLIAYETYYGNIHESSPCSVANNTLFDLQSITKVIATTPVLMALIRQKVLALDDSTSKFIPEIRDKDSITIKHLLLHMSGYSDEDFRKKFNSRDEGWAIMFTAALRFLPGTSVEYSDVGYRLLGLALERATGDNLQNLAQKLVWQPLAMNDTTYLIDKFQKERIAGHGSSWGRVDDMQDYLLGSILGCDGVFSTAADLAKFCQHTLKLFKNNTEYFEISGGDSKKFTSFYDSLGLGGKVCGWEVHKTSNSYCGRCRTKNVLEKAGGAGAFISILPENDKFFIYLTNHGRPDPFTADSWNQMVHSLCTQIIAELVLN